MAPAVNPTPAPLAANDVDVFLGLLEAAWGVIANVSGSDWTKQSPEWQDAAVRWREAYHAQLAASTAEEIRTGFPSPSAALYGFTAWLTGRDEPITIGSHADCAPVAALVKAFCESQGYAPPPANFDKRLRPYPTHVATHTLAEN